MRVTEAFDMLRRLGLPITLPPQPLVGVSTKVSARPLFPDLEQKHRERVAKIEREHAERVRKEKADADARIARQQQHTAHLAAESELHKRLLREQAIVRRQEQDRVELASRRDYRQFKKAIGLPLSLIDCRQLLDEWIEETPTPDDPIVQVLAPWLEASATRHRIDVRPCVEVRLSNGSAVRKARTVEVGKRQTVRQCLIEAHEHGHILHDELADYREVPLEFGRRVSVPAEIASWRWVLNTIPVWTAPMHSDMTRFITSYRSYATPDEAAAIDALCSEDSFLATIRRTRIL